MTLFLGWEIGRGEWREEYPQKTKKTKKPLHGNICTPASPRARFLCAGLSRMLWTYHLALELPNGIFFLKAVLIIQFHSGFASSFCTGIHIKIHILLSPTMESPTEKNNLQCHGISFLK